MTHYRIIHDKFLKKYLIQRKFLWFFWVKWCQSVNNEQLSGTNRSYWGFANQKAAEDHLETFLKEEEVRRLIDLEMNSKSRMVVVKELVK